MDPLARTLALWKGERDIQCSKGSVKGLIIAGKKEALKLAETLAKGAAKLAVKPATKPAPQAAAKPAWKRWLRLRFC